MRKEQAISCHFRSHRDELGRNHDDTVVRKKIFKIGFCSLPCPDSMIRSRYGLPFPSTRGFRVWGGSPALVCWGEGQRSAQLKLLLALTSFCSSQLCRIRFHRLFWDPDGEHGRVPHLSNTMPCPTPFALSAKGVKLSSDLKCRPFKMRGESRLSSCGWRFRQIRSLGH
jgi:hypothetical protein